MSSQLDQTDTDKPICSHQAETTPVTRRSAKRLRATSSSQEQSPEPIEPIEPTEPTESNTKLKQEFLCDKCNYKTCKKHFFDKHVQKHEGTSFQTESNKLFECENCDKKFKDILTLNNHRNLHFGLKPFKCDDCDDVFGTKGELTRHIKYKHTLEKPHKCTSCDYSTVEYSKLKRHMRIHTDERPYLCGFCDYASRDTFKLKRHLRTHTGEKPYECPICKNCFTQSNTLKAHIKSYHKEVPIVLNETDSPSQSSQLDQSLATNKRKYKLRKLKDCNKIAKTASNIDENSNADSADSLTVKKEQLSTLMIPEQDLQSKEDQNWYKCEQCFMRFLTKDLFDEHHVKHTGQRPYECEICGIKFSHKFALRAHLMSHDAGYNEKLKQTLTTASQMTKSRFNRRLSCFKEAKKSDGVKAIITIAQDNESAISSNTSLEECNLEDRRTHLDTEGLNPLDLSSNEIEDESNTDQAVRDTLNTILNKICAFNDQSPVLIDLTNDDEPNENLCAKGIQKPTRQRLIAPLDKTPAKINQTILIRLITSPIQQPVYLNPSQITIVQSMNNQPAGFIIPLSTPPSPQIIQSPTLSHDLNINTPSKKPEPRTPVKVSLNKKEEKEKLLNKSIEDSIEKTLESLVETQIESPQSSKKPTVQFRAGQRKKVIQATENSFVIMNSEVSGPLKGESVNKCKNCEKVFDSELKLNRHMKDIHRKVVIRNETIQTEDFISHLNTTVKKVSHEPEILPINEPNSGVLKRHASDSSLVVKSIYDQNLDQDSTFTPFVKPKRGQAKMNRSTSHLAVTDDNPTPKSVTEETEPKRKLRKRNQS